MSFSSAQAARLAIGSTEIATYATNVTSTVEFDMLDSTTLADTAKRNIAGQGGGSAQVQGWLDTASQAATFGHLNLLESLLGRPGTCTYAPQGWGVANTCTLINGRMASFEEGSPVGGLSNFSLDLTGDAHVAPGLILHGLTAETADANGTTVDRGADVVSTPSGAVAHLHVSAYSGLTNNIVTIEDSANNSVWSTIGTFATYTATTYERIYISGTVRRYVRAVWNVTGTGSTTFAVALAPL